MADEVLKEDDDDITVIETVDEKIPAPRPEGDEEDSSRLEAERDDDEDGRGPAGWVHRMQNAQGGRSGGQPCKAALGVSRELRQAG